MNSSFTPPEMAISAAAAAALMKALSNEHRLVILCDLIAAGELSAGQLVERSGLGQSALSQHLAKLREEGLVVFRREAQILFYRIADERAGRVLEVLHDIFCPGPDRESGDSRMSKSAGSREDHPKGE